MLHPRVCVLHSPVCGAAHHVCVFAPPCLWVCTPLFVGLQNIVCGLHHLVCVFFLHLLVCEVLAPIVCWFFAPPCLWFFLHPLVCGGFCTSWFVVFLHTLFVGFLHALFVGFLHALFVGFFARLACGATRWLPCLLGCTVAPLFVQSHPLFVRMYTFFVRAAHLVRLVAPLFFLRRKNQPPPSTICKIERSARVEVDHGSRPACLKSRSTSWDGGQWPSAPLTPGSSSRDIDTARATVQENNDSHRSRHTCSTRFRNKGLSERAFARAEELENDWVFGDQRPPTSTPSTTKRARPG